MLAPLPPSAKGGGGQLPPWLRRRCMVHYKKTHTNINVKEKSNHPPYMKKGIIKGFYLYFIFS